MHFVSIGDDSAEWLNLVPKSPTAPPGQIAEDAFVGEVPKARRGRYRQVDVCQVGETHGRVSHEIAASGKKP